MQIISTRVAPKAAPNQKALDAPKPEETGAPVFKPLSESWSVGEDTYASTADLLAKAGDADSLAATYNFTTEEKPAVFSGKEKAMNAAGGAILGATAGTVVGGIAGAALGFMSELGDLANGLMGGHMTGTSSAVVLVPLLAGAAIGAVAGGVTGGREQPEAAGGHVTGVLQKSKDGAFFYPDGKVENKVDLNAFKNAAVPELKAEQTAKSSTLKNALLGAAAGAAVLPSQFIPLVGVFGASVAGYQLGKAADRRTSLGAGLGLLGGAAATGGAIWTLNQAMNNGGGWPLALGVAGGMAVAGAAVGAAVMPKTEVVPAHRDYGAQWWNKAQPQEA